MRAASLSVPGASGLAPALRLSLALHGGIVVLALLLPQWHRTPDIPPPRVVEAVLVSSTRPPAPRPAPLPAPEPSPTPPPATTAPEPPPPAPAPKPVPVPASVPKVAVPAPKPAEKPAVKPAPEPVRPALRPQPLNRSALDAEMEALNRELRQREADAEAERLRRELDRSAAAARASANQQVVDRHQRLIQQRVATKWNRPLTARRGMVTMLRITVLPGGEVGSVVTTTSSGDAAFDASAEEAVRRASPLPVPDDIAVFNQNFRSFTFRFSPEDL